MKKLQMGRIGAIIESEFVFKNYSFSKGVPEAAFRKAGCLADADDLFIAFSPKTIKGPEYAKLIAGKVEAMRKDGSLAKLLAKYGVTDWIK
jgi:polar amino acid transport system substrate-binding protein